MKQLIDPSQWERRAHFDFFKNFQEPFFGVTVEVDCTIAYEEAKRHAYSFFLYYLHQSLTAANQVDAFKLRILGDDVWRYDVVHASPTINRPDGTFGFAYMDYEKDFFIFRQKAKAVIEHMEHTHGLVPALTGENVIHYSSIPWIRFTGLSHARSYHHADSIPKISFGKMTDENGKKKMPMSVHAHHGLMDGWHVGQYIDRFQELMNNSGQRA